MFGIINARVYAIIAIAVGGVLVAIAYFDTNQASGTFFRSIAGDARPFLGGTVTDFIFQPLVLVVTDIYWAAGAGLLWPVLIIWVLLFLIGLGATIVGPAISKIDNI